MIYLLFEERPSLFHITCVLNYNSEQKTFNTAHYRAKHFLKDFH